MNRTTSNCLAEDGSALRTEAFRLLDAAHHVRLALQLGSRPLAGRICWLLNRALARRSVPDTKAIAFGPEPPVDIALREIRAHRVVWLRALQDRLTAGEAHLASEELFRLDALEARWLDEHGTVPF